MILSQETIDELGLILEKRGYKTSKDELYKIATGVVGFFKTLIDMEKKYKTDKTKNEQIEK